jgi:ubiquinone/menaquinone biosynthesis C-methylase UbiE
MPNFKEIAENAIKSGNISIAFNNYKAYISNNPLDHEVLNNLGVLSINYSKFSDAVDYLFAAINLCDKNEYKLNFIEAFKKDTRSEFNDAHLDVVAKLLKSNLVRPVDLAYKIHYHLKEHHCYKLLKLNYHSLFDFKIACDSIYEQEIFLTLLQTTHVPDLDFEINLRSIRKILSKSLLNNEKIGNQEINLLESLAIQFDINEYIINNDEEDILIHNELIKKYKLLSTEEELNRYLLASASLCFEENSEFEKILEKSSNSNVKDYWLTKIIIKNSICQYDFTFEDEISKRMKRQYEVNPYPRWIYTAVPLLKKPYDTEFNINKITPPQIENFFEILIAGCGTGQHAIQTASNYKNSHVTAIDLSEKSIVYAKHKSSKLGIENIKFECADILEYNSKGTKFHLIESIGVLHHLSVPSKGLLALRNLLDDNGLMKIGLYSKEARLNLVAIKNELRLNSNIQDELLLRQERERIINYIMKNPKYSNIFNFSDFYNLSEFKDLFFNESEHLYELKEIPKFLAQEGLEFLNLDINFNILYKDQIDSKIPFFNDVDSWSILEKKYPWIFSGMYIFWCKKINNKKIYQNKKNYG